MHSVALWNYCLALYKERFLHVYQNYALLTTLLIIILLLKLLFDLMHIIFIFIQK